MPAAPQLRRFMELQIRNVTKTDADGVQALERIDLTVAPGMFGLPGHNGARGSR